MLSCMSKAIQVGRDGVEDKSSGKVAGGNQALPRDGEKSIPNVHTWGDCGVAGFTGDAKSKEFLSWVSNVPPQRKLILRPKQWPEFLLHIKS